jgi:hypothetical protein
MSSAYHPQSDGQTEIVNKVLQQYLRCFAHDKPTLWGQYLHWAEWHYNTAIHTSTGLTPFQVVYGRNPPTLTDYISGSSHVQAVDATLTDRETVLQNLKNKLLKAQATMKLQADQHRTPHKFKVGDLVFVKLRPYRQNSVMGRRIHKLSKRFYGPFRLTKAIGEVAFELELPPTSRIHPVFHVSQLKPCFDDNTVTLDLPQGTVDNKPLVKPLAVLDWKQNAWNDKIEVLIQWEGLFPEDATWEDFHDIKSTYPTFDLEDKVSLNGTRDVTKQVAGGEARSNMDQEEPNIQVKDKRVSVKPTKYQDFVMPSLKKGGKK